MSACVEHSAGAPPPWGISRHSNSPSRVDQTQHWSQDWDASRSAASLPAPVDNGRCVSLLQSLLESLRRTLEISRLPIGVAQGASQILDAVEQRQRCGVMDWTTDVEVLSAVLAQLRLVLAPDRACGTASTPALATTDEAEPQIVSHTTDELLMGDPWDGCEDIATEDLFEWYAQGLRAGCYEALPAGADDRQSLLEAPCGFVPALSSKSYSSSYLAPMKSPRCQSIGSASTLSSLDFGGFERFSTTSTISSVQAGMSVTSSSRTSVEPWDAELCHPREQSSESESMWQRLRRLSAPPAPQFISSFRSNDPDSRLYCEQRLDTAELPELRGTTSSGNPLRPSDLVPETTRRMESGMTWQQMWKRKLESSSSLQDAES